MTMRRRTARIWRAVLLTAAVSAAAPLAGAQRADAPAGPPPGRRAQLERQFRERLATVVQQRLHLTDAQLKRLEQTNSHFEGQRRQLVQQEREARVAIREEVLKDSAANQTRVAELIDRAIAIQRQRLDLVQQEQRELAQFMTPVQRAQYLDLQEKLRQRVEQLRRQQQQRRGDGPAAGALRGRGRFGP
jgi:Spy/CpxP family protein refolding chaperone